MDKSLYGELKMFLYSKFTFFHRNLDKNAFIDYYYTHMKNKIKLISYLFGFNALAVMFTVCWMLVMLPYYLFKSASNCISQSFSAILNENKRIWNALSYSQKKEQNETKTSREEIAQWLQ